MAGYAIAAKAQKLRMFRSGPAAFGDDFRQIAAGQIYAQRLGDVQAFVDVLFQQQPEALAAEGHQWAFERLPDEFGTGLDAVLGYIETEGILAEAHDVLFALAVVADQAQQGVGGGADGG